MRRGKWSGWDAHKASCRNSELRREKDEIKDRKRANTERKREIRKEKV